MGFIFINWCALAWGNET